jgi:hypothetical protein
MQYVKYLLWITFVVLTSFRTFSEDDKPTIRVSVMSSQELPAEFDSARTYQYAFVCTDPESVLTELWNADVRVWRAWLPLDNMCMGPIGPRFTVELDGGDSAILDFDFSPGEGRLHCATRLKRFVISD